MYSFEELVNSFAEKFAARHFPAEPASLYDPGQYFLGIGGKRIRPVMCLMGNELFGAILPDAYHAATAIELFHNFTLIHDDIMDQAPLRRGMQTVHMKFGLPTALLAGDVMLVAAYENINKINVSFLQKILHHFNLAAKQVCEGQQLDMDFEKREQVGMDEYLRMIELKTSVLLAASLQLGAIIGGAGGKNQQYLYDFGKNLGIAFQVQDDYLDAFGDPAKFGKQVGGDIMANKKTFLVARVMESGTKAQVNELNALMKTEPSGKIEKVLSLFQECGVDKWAFDLKDRYLDLAYQRLEDIAVQNIRKEPLRQLAQFLIRRDH